MSRRRRVVVLDMMDTILTDPYREAIEAGTGKGLEELRPLLIGTRWPDFECNRITEHEYLAAFRDAGIALDLDAFHRARRDGYDWIDGMQELVADLRPAVEVVVASNYPDWLDAVADDWFRRLVDGVIGSCHLGERKPDPAFFAGVLDWLEVAPEATWFVDDRPHNVEAASALGMHARLFASGADTRAWLKDEGLLGA